MTNYIDNTTDDATTYKGKIDESLNLLRGVPVSSTTSGGSAGVDYEVSEWASLTLTSGILYAFRAHTDNTGACHVDHGGSPVNIKLADGSNPPAGAIVDDGVSFFWYDGTNLVLINPFSAGLASAPLEDDDLASNGGNVVTEDNANVFSDVQTISSAGPVLAFVETDVAADNQRWQLDASTARFSGRIRSDDLATTVSWLQVDRTGTTVDIVNFPNGTLQAGGSNVLKASDIGSTVQAQDAQLQDLADSLTATAAELNQLDGITRVGDVIAEESFSIGGDFTATGYAKSERGNGGNWVTVSVPIMSHSSKSDPISASGDLPSAYRPVDNHGNTYSTSSIAVKQCTINTSGILIFSYYDWAGSGQSATTTGAAVSMTYFVPD